MSVRSALASSPPPLCAGGMEGWSLTVGAVTLLLQEWSAACGSAGPMQRLLLLDSSRAHGIWKLSSSTRDQTHTLCSRRVEF